MELANATNGFAESQILGRGHAGNVYKGNLEEGLQVAVKVLNGPTGGGFQDEVRLLSRCHHPNVAMLLGYAMDFEAEKLRDNVDPGFEPASGRRCLVYELLPGTSAFARLRAGDYPWSERLQTAIDASRGLTHLHKFRPELFHRDVKSANILFSADGTAKIADFGLACASRVHSGLYSAVAVANGTPGYSAPEYCSTGIVTESAEVYSMGMVLVELLTARQPARAGPGGNFTFLLSEIRPDLEGARDRIIDMVDRKAGWPWIAAANLATFALSVVQENQSRRPRFLEVVAVLQNIQFASDARSEPTGDIKIPVTGPTAPPHSNAIDLVGDRERERRSPASLPSSASGPLTWLTKRWNSPAPSSDQLDGLWVHKSNPSIVECIKGDIVYGQVGSVTAVIIAREADSITIEFEGSIFRATLVQDELLWDDGDVWSRKPLRNVMDLVPPLPGASSIVAEKVSEGMTSKVSTIAAAPDFSDVTLLQAREVSRGVQLESESVSILQEYKMTAGVAESAVAIPSGVDVAPNGKPQDDLCQAELLASERGPSARQPQAPIFAADRAQEKLEPATTNDAELHGFDRLHHIGDLVS